MPSKQRSNRTARYVIAATIILLAIGFTYRYTILFTVQYACLQSIACSQQKAEGERTCFKKLWVHRVNSVSRYNILRDRFEGFETDIVFDQPSRSFLVYHPFIAQEDTVTLNEFLKHADLQKDQFWMDTRSVDGSNANEALASLADTSIDQRIKSACIFELYDVDAAEIFAKNGYRVSLNVSEQAQQELLKHRNLLDSLGKKMANIPYVSQQSDNIELLKRFFPSKKIITWHLSYKDSFKTNTLQQLMNDPQIEIILINVKTP